MLQNLSRFFVSVMFGALLALPFVGPAFVAHAQPLEAEDFLSDDFSDATGLGQADLQETIGNLIRIALGFLGVVTVCIILYAGFKWMTAGGNDDKVGEAKRMMISGLIGLAIILAAYAISSFVITSVISATS